MEDSYENNQVHAVHNELSAILKQKHSRTRTDELPLDIVFDIFLRMPVKSLFRFRCVSKPWCNIIDNPCLAIMHITRTGAAEEEPPTPLLLSGPTLRKSTNTMNLYLIKDKCRSLEPNDHYPMAEFDSSGYLGGGYCNGLLYFVEHGQGNEGFITVMNPLRKEIQSLPLAKIQSPHVQCNRETYTMGFDISTNTFKMVCVFFRQIDYRPPSYSLGTLVLTLGTNSWNELSEAPPYPISGKAVFAQGVLHWNTSPFFVSDNLIVSFDVGKEKFGLISPNFDSKDCYLLQLFDLNGDLGMVTLSRNTKIEIWVMKDYEKKECVKKYRIYCDVRRDRGYIKVIGPWKNGEILLKLYDGYFIYNHKTDLLYPYSTGLNLDSTVLLSHRWSLISLSKVMAV